MVQGPPRVRGREIARHGRGDFWYRKTHGGRDRTQQRHDFGYARTWGSPVWLYSRRVRTYLQAYVHADGEAHTYGHTRSMTLPGAVAAGSWINPTRGRNNGVGGRRT